MKKLIGLLTILALTLLLSAQEDVTKIKSQRVIRFQIQKPNFTLVLERETTDKTSDTSSMMMQIFKKSNKMLTK
jgi:hypothetical protein